MIPLPDHPRRRGARHERGLSESLQWSVLTPLVMLAVLGLIQAGIVLHGRTVAANAALAAAEAQSVAGAGSGAGERVGREIADRGGLKGIGISVGEQGAEVVVTLTAHVDGFFPIGLDEVSSRVAMPKEAP